MLPGALRWHYQTSPSGQGFPGCDMTYITSTGSPGKHPLAVSCPSTSCFAQPFPRLLNTCSLPLLTQPHPELTLSLPLLNGSQGKQELSSAPPKDFSWHRLQQPGQGSEIGQWISHRKPQTQQMSTAKAARFLRLSLHCVCGSVCKK